MANSYWDEIEFTPREQPHPDTEKSILGEALSAGVQTVGNLMAAPATAAIDIGKSLYKDVERLKSGEFVGPGQSMIEGIIEAQKQQGQKSEAARAAGLDTLSNIYKGAQYAPIVGPAVTGLLEAAHEGDASKWGRILGNAIAPTKLGRAASVTEVLPFTSAEGLRSSAASNWESMFNLPKSEFGSSKVPRMEATAKAMVDIGNPPLAGSRKALINKLDETLKAYEGATDQAAAGKYLDTINDIIEPLGKYGTEKYYKKSALGRDILMYPEKEAMLNQVGQELINASDWVTQNPKQIGVGGAASNKPQLKIPQEIVLEKRRSLDEATITPKNKWEEQLGPETAGRINRAHANQLRQILNKANPDIKELNKFISTYSTAQEFLQEAYNRNKVSGPIPMPGFNTATGKLTIPNAFRESFLNIPWNSISARTKTALANAIESGNMTKANRILQFARLGVPVNDE